MSEADSEEVGVPPIVVKAALYAVTDDVENGEIRSYAQLTAFIAHLGKLPTKRLLDKLWSKATRSLSSSDCERIGADWSIDCEPDLLQAFRTIDRNHDNRLSFVELERMLMRQNDGDASTQEMMTIFTDADVNSDGYVDYHEFVSLYTATAKDTVEQNVANYLAAQRETAVSESSGEQSVQERASSQSVGSSTSGSVREILPYRRDSESTFATVQFIDNQLIVRHPPVVHTNMPTVRSFYFPQNIFQTSVTCTFRRGAFYRNEDDSIITNSFTLNVSHSGEVTVGVRPVENNDLPPLPSTTCIDMIVTVLDKESGKLVDVSTETDTTDGWRFVSMTLEKGIYTLIPYHFGHRLKKRTTHGVRPELNDDGGKKLTKRFRMVLMNIFDVFDADQDGFLNRAEFNLYNVRTGDEAVTDHEWNVVCDQFDTRDSRLTMKGFTQLHTMEVNEGELDDVWMALEQCGYDNTLAMAHAQPYEVFTSTGNLELADYVSVDTVVEQLIDRVEDGEKVEGCNYSMMKLSSGMMLLTDGQNNEVSTVSAYNSIVTTIGGQRQAVAVIPKDITKSYNCVLDVK